MTRDKAVRTLMYSVSHTWTLLYLNMTFTPAGSKSVWGCVAVPMPWGNVWRKEKVWRKQKSPRWCWLAGRVHTTHAQADFSHLVFLASRCRICFSCCCCRWREEWVISYPDRPSWMIFSWWICFRRKVTLRIVTAAGSQLQEEKKGRKETQEQEEKK